MRGDGLTAQTNCAKYKNAINLIVRYLKPSNTSVRLFIPIVAGMTKITIFTPVAIKLHIMWVLLTY